MMKLKTHPKSKCENRAPLLKQDVAGMAKPQIEQRRERRNHMWKIVEMGRMSLRINAAVSTML
jgi:hypothetical protein